MVLLSRSIGREPNERTKTENPFERLDLRRNNNLYHHLCKILREEDLLDQLWVQNLHARRERNGTLILVYSSTLPSQRVLDTICAISSTHWDLCFGN